MYIEQLSSLYLNNHLANRSSFETTKRLIRNTFGRLERFLVGELTPQTVLEWHTSLANTPYQANRSLGVLRSMMRWGIRLQLCQTDPTAGIRRFTVSDRSRFLNTDEVARLFAALPLAEKKIQLFILIVLATGCRRGEARNIKWSDIDLQHRRWTKPRTKNGKWHVVPLPSQIIKVMRKYNRESEWVFPGDNGKAWSLSGIEKAWGKVRSRCNLSDVRIHDLRRTAASHMAINGENLSTIQKMLDHSSLQATAIYARLNLDALDGALQRNADRFFSPERMPSC